MDITERTAGDCVELQNRIRQEQDAKQRDRYRAALLAIEGRQTQQIIDALGRSRGFVQRWTYAYRDGGINAIVAKSPPGLPLNISPSQQRQFLERFAAGPTEADGGRCTLRGADAIRILEQEFGVSYSLSGVYYLLHRLGFSCLKPRPKHRKQDPKAQKQWLDQAPLLSRRSSETIPPRQSKCGSKTKRGLASKGH
jgi:transposase